MNSVGGRASEKPASVASRLGSMHLDKASLIQGIAVVAVVIFAVSTPWFLSTTSIRSLLTTVSFVGCVAVGMTFIRLSGNIMSFSIGASMSATTIVFMASIALGLIPALILAFLFCAALNGIQGWLIGFFRANPLIISMAAYSMIIGSAVYITGGRGVYPLTNKADILTANLGPIPGPLAAFLFVAIAGQLILSFTRLGRNIYLVGTSPRAAKAAGIEPWRTVLWAYVAAGLCTAASAVLVAARYRSGDMEHGIGYEYHAISAVLVGGTSIRGGEGSVLRTLVGTVFIALMQGLLILRGFGIELQYLLIGLIVLAAIMLQWKVRT
jgi:ribose/xylose/arabinose/galactoside ABC-type transport system permease subunit